MDTTNTVMSGPRALLGTRFVSILVAMLLGISATLAQAETTKEEHAANMKQIREVLKVVYPEVPYFDIQPSPMEGIYAVGLGDASTFYASKDGLHYLSGELFQVRGTSVISLTEREEEVKRRKMMVELQENDMIVFPAKQQKAKITVFTDIDCGYCQKLHLEVPKLNELGVTVRYLAWPRAGIGSRSYKKVVTAWCSKDRAAALTKLKARKPVPEINCESPVEEHYLLGQRLGLRGTPSILLEDGQMIPGYLPAKDLSAKAIKAAGS